MRKFHVFTLVSVSVFFSCRQRSDITGSRAYSDMPVSSETQTFVKLLDDSCGPSCHGSGPNGVPGGKITKWAQESVELHQCLTRLECFKPTLAVDTAKACVSTCQKSGDSLKEKIGFYRLLLADKYYDDLLKAAGEDPDEVNVYKAKVMPPAPRKFSGDFSKLIKWAEEQSKTTPPFAEIAALKKSASVATTCKDSISPSLQEYISIEQERETNWTSIHERDRRFKVFGCPNGVWQDNPSSCLKGFPNVPAWRTTDPKAADLKYSMRVIRTLPPTTTYWMRSSPDGRWVGNGGVATTDPGSLPDGFSGVIDDLTSPLDNLRRIAVEAQYDPGFTPDNKNFIFHGGPSGMLNCPLANLYNKNTKFIGASTSGCEVVANVGLYQSIGGKSSKENFLLAPTYNGDNPGQAPDDFSRDNEAPDGESNLKIIHLTQEAEGNKREDKEFTFNQEGDFMIAPSGDFMVSRFNYGATGKKQVGYRLRFLRDGAKLNPTAEGKTSEICLAGGKPQISYDNRFMVFHHINSGDAQQDVGIEKQKGKNSNIYLYDLAEAKWLRITNMGERQYALYPHFRADGWIYFLVRDHTRGQDPVHSVVATDIAVALAKGARLPGESGSGKKKSEKSDDK